MFINFQCKDRYFNVTFKQPFSAQILRIETNRFLTDPISFAQSWKFNMDLFCVSAAIIKKKCSEIKFH